MEILNKSKTERMRDMKIIVTSDGESMDSSVDQRFGRARYFILYDTETQESSVHDNKQNLEAAQGAGIQAGQKVSELGASAVITGHCGPRAFATLTAGNVEIYPGVTGTVRKAIDDFQSGKLKKAGNADVGGHFGSV